MQALSPFSNIGQWTVATTQCITDTTLLLENFLRTPGKIPLVGTLSGLAGRLPMGGFQDAAGLVILKVGLVEAALGLLVLNGNLIQAGLYTCEYGIRTCFNGTANIIRSIVEVVPGLNTVACGLWDLRWGTNEFISYTPQFVRPPSIQAFRP